MSIEQNNSALASCRVSATYGINIVDCTQHLKKEMVGDSSNIDATIAPVGISREAGHHCSFQGL